MLQTIPLAIIFISRADPCSVFKSTLFNIILDKTNLEWYSFISAQVGFQRFIDELNVQNKQPITLKNAKNIYSNFRSVLIWNFWEHYDHTQH